MTESARDALEAILQEIEDGELQATVIQRAYISGALRALDSEASD